MDNRTIVLLRAKDGTFFEEKFAHHKAAENKFKSIFDGWLKPDFFGLILDGGLCLKESILWVKLVTPEQANIYKNSIIYQKYDQEDILK